MIVTVMDGEYHTISDESLEEIYDIYFNDALKIGDLYSEDNYQELLYIAVDNDLSVAELLLWGSVFNTILNLGAKK